MRRWFVFAVLGLSASLGFVPAASPHRSAVDPIIGTWKFTGGASGTIKIAYGSGSTAILETAVTPVTIECYSASAGTVIGAIELPEQAKLPKNHYNGNISDLHKCDENFDIVLSGNSLTYTVRPFSPGATPSIKGPFELERVGSGSAATKYSWAADVRDVRDKTVGALFSIHGSGTFSAGSGGKLTATTGSFTFKYGTALGHRGTVVAAVHAAGGIFRSTGHEYVAFHFAVTNAAQGGVFAKPCTSKPSGNIALTHASVDEVVFSACGIDTEDWKESPKVHVVVKITKLG